jgi:hypothetical protein
MDKKFAAFVVHEHRTPMGIHWDLMLRKGDVLWTWRMDCSPAEIGKTPLPLVKISDHPLRFLTFEGPVQNQTGRVKFADEGTYELTAQTPDELAVYFHGHTLNGAFTLHQTDAENHWVLTRL